MRSHSNQTHMLLNVRVTDECTLAVGVAARVENRYAKMLLWATALPSPAQGQMLCCDLGIEISETRLSLLCFPISLLPSSRDLISDQLILSVPPHTRIRTPHTRAFV